MTLSGELATVEDETEPRRGTKAWIEARPLVEWDGVYVPDSHRLPDGATILRGDDDGYCRVIMPERGRCRATRIRGMQLCSAHAGGGDPLAASRAGTAARVALKERRKLLGIGPGRVGNPRSQARLRALERADEIAQALIDAPLDDDSLGSLERQTAVLRGLDATFPLQSSTVEIELPVSGEAVAAMSWESMQELASRLLEPVPSLYQGEESA